MKFNGAVHFAFGQMQRMAEDGELTTQTIGTYSGGWRMKKDCRAMAYLYKEGLISVTLNAKGRKAYAHLNARYSVDVSKFLHSIKLEKVDEDYVFERNKYIFETSEGVISFVFCTQQTYKNIKRYIPINVHRKMLRLRKKNVESLVMKNIGLFFSKVPDLHLPFTEQSVMTAISNDNDPDNREYYSSLIKYFQGGYDVKDS